MTNKLIKMKYGLLLFTFSTFNTSYNSKDGYSILSMSEYEEENKNVPMCFGNTIKLITLPFVALLPIAALIFGIVDMNGIQDMQYNLIFENQYQLAVSCPTYSLEDMRL